MRVNDAQCPGDGEYYVRFIGINCAVSDAGYLPNPSSFCN
jgi:hypothetical protein